MDYFCKKSSSLPLIPSPRCLNWPWISSWKLRRDFCPSEQEVWGVFPRAIALALNGQSDWLHNQSCICYEILLLVPAQYFLLSLFLSFRVGCMSFSYSTLTQPVACACFSLPYLNASASAGCTVSGWTLLWFSGFMEAFYLRESLVPLCSGALHAPIPYRNAGMPFFPL